MKLAEKTLGSGSVEGFINKTQRRQALASITRSIKVRSSSIITENRCLRKQCDLSGRCQLISFGPNFRFSQEVVESYQIVDFHRDSIHVSPVLDVANFWVRSQFLRITPCRGLCKMTWEIWLSTTDIVTDKVNVSENATLRWFATEQADVVGFVCSIHREYGGWLSRKEEKERYKQCMTKQGLTTSTFTHHSLVSSEDTLSQDTVHNL